ncbi:ABC transporter C family member 10-like isoform X3 [Vitis riparia]|uniref:ABC transporter C family member 10-like isoform X3 n=1 Tax=Vitis riparia TaxID=96939 RepID=UPI00155A77E4|nr:ABC transporter C family member 10-like isoform X3 [Vitis riparia]
MRDGEILDGLCSYGFVKARRYNMGETLWTVFCGSSWCWSKIGKICSSGFLAIICPCSCLNHILVISVDIIVLLYLLFIFIYKAPAMKILSPQQSRCFSTMLNSAAFLNGSLGLVYLGLGFWIVGEKLGEENTILPLHGWLVVLLQGFTWFFLGLAVRFKRHQLLHNVGLRLCSVLAFFIAGFPCVTSFWEAIVGDAVSVKVILDVISFPGAILLMFCTFTGPKSAGTDSGFDGAAFYTPLPGEGSSGGDKINTDASLPPFEKAGLISRMSFWWLNSLMKKGKQKTLEDKDIPQLRREDRAEMCYLMFMEQQNKQKQQSSDSPSILSTILLWQWKQILISGFFALMKVLTLSTGPLFLRAFILVAEGKEAFKYEGYALTGGLFLTKCLESLSERQWFFRTRLIGLQVRSFLSAAIYQKQLKLSNTAKGLYSPGQIVSFVIIDAYNIGEFPYWFHQIWSTSLQLCLALIIIYYSLGLATIAALFVVILTVVANSPMGRLQHKYQKMLMGTQDKRLKAFTEALTNMKSLKLYAWETHFKNVIERLRKEEFKWLVSVLSQKGYSLILFWSSPIVVSAITFSACYFIGTTLSASNVFTFMASLRIAQEPIRLIPDVITAFIEAKVSLDRIAKFLDAPELQNKHVRKMCDGKELEESIFIKSNRISWEDNSTRATLRNINLVVKPGERVAICGEVGSGKSTLLAAILGEVPHVNGMVRVYGKIAYVSQTAWIPTGTIQENILFGSAMDPYRYREAIEKCALVKDLEMLPFGDLTEIGERGVNLSGGQKQRVQLARALYQDADVYLLDDPFSAVDAHTATSLFNEYVMGALSTKTVILVTHQVDFLPAFDSVLLMSEGEILQAATFEQLMHSSQEFQDLVNAHNATVRSERQPEHDSTQKSKIQKGEIQKIYTEKQLRETSGEQLIKKEERETGDTGLKPYLQYLKYSKGFLYFFLATLSHITFIVEQLVQNYWLAANIHNSSVSQLKLITVYTGIGLSLSLFLLLRSFFVVLLGLGASQSIFSTLLSSLFRAPMSFYDSTPLGRILSRVSSDLSVVDLDVAFKFTVAVGTTMNAYANFGVLTILAWELVFVILPTIYLSILIQRYYFAAGKELMRINGTTKSFIASHLSESIAGAMTIRAFGEEDRHFSKNLGLIDMNASPFFYSFTANEWLILRLEILSAIVLSSSGLALTLLQTSTSKSGFIGMALSYGLSANVFLVFSVQNQCNLANMIVSVERLEQYMNIPSEAPEVIESNRPPVSWPAIGEVEIYDLKVKYRPNAPLVLHGISCKFGGGQKIGIVGRTGSGKTTLISILFRLVEPTEGQIIIDGIDIATIGLHDLRSRLGIIPQEPTLFSGSVRYNLDPLSLHTDEEIWAVLEKCQLRGAVQEKEEGLDSLVVQDGSNWSMGQRQLFCLGRALLRRSRILVLDEATASIDNATDSILQKTIRTEFADCTVITVAHRIPTVMDCTMVLAISDGKLVEYDEPMKLIKEEGSLFGQLVKEYWSRSSNGSNASGDWL